MPTPQPNETEQEFVSRCIPIVSSEHPEWENDQCVAVCYSMWREKDKKTEAYRHRDFQRIYNEFVTYYKDRVKGESEYYAWLKALKLNENSDYANAKESFKWAKNMLQPLREDTDNKYYKILVGFPLKSMNGNVYKERDLIAAALDLKGKHPSLNHKNQFWFSPNNPYNDWGNITIIDGKYEEGAIETILQVPKTAVCPICNGEKMTKLIDEQKIVNVSLEGNCGGGFCQITGECEGFHFADPPFTLLTSDVLPGIPLARIKPLESIMVEALQSANETNRNEEKKVTTKTITLKMKEEEDKKVKELEETDFAKPLKPTLHDNKPETVQGTPVNKEMPEKSGSPAKQETAEPLDPKLRHSEEKVKRIKAEGVAKGLEEQVAILEKDNMELEKTKSELIGTNKEQKETIERLEQKNTKLTQEYTQTLRNVEVERDRWKHLRDETAGERDDIKLAHEDLQRKHTELSKKYDNAMTTNLELTRKITKANEDYLAIAKERDDIAEALKRAKINAKKTIRIKA